LKQIYKIYISRYRKKIL